VKYLKKIQQSCCGTSNNRACWKASASNKQLLCCWNLLI